MSDPAIRDAIKSLRWDRRSRGTPCLFKCGRVHYQCVATAPSVRGAALRSMGGGCPLPNCGRKAIGIASWSDDGLSSFN